MDIFCHKNAFNSVIPSFKNKIKAVWNFPRRFFRFLKKLAEYSVILWNDYDFDHVYIYKLLKYKISRHRENMEADKWHKNSPRYVKQMRVCETLLDRLIKNKYSDYLWDQYEKKWGTADWQFEDSVKEGYSKLNITYPNCKTAEQEKQRKKEVIYMSKYETNQRKQDLEYFSKIFVKYSQSWWT